MGGRGIGRRHKVDVCLWYRQADENSMGHLDQLAVFWQEITRLDRVAKAELFEQVDEPDSVVQEFLMDWLEQSDEGDLSETLGETDADAIDLSQVAKALHLHHVGLWLEGPNSVAVFDYVINEKANDQILAVKFFLNGAIKSIDWES